MALLSEEQQQLMTFAGFVERFESYWLHEGMTQEKAFDEVNRDLLLLTGVARYESDAYDSFLRAYKRRLAKARMSQV